VGVDVHGGTSASGKMKENRKTKRQSLLVIRSAKPRQVTGAKNPTMRFMSRQRKKTMEADNRFTYKDERLSFSPP
jgi:hypothetical protein